MSAVCRCDHPHLPGATGCYACGLPLAERPTIVPPAAERATPPARETATPAPPAGGTWTTDRSLGQVAYEQYALVFAGGKGQPRGGKAAWDRLRPGERARWETIATAVVEECGGSHG